MELPFEFIKIIVFKFPEMRIWYEKNNRRNHHQLMGIVVENRKEKKEIMEYQNSNSTLTNQPIDQSINSIHLWYSFNFIKHSNTRTIRPHSNRSWNANKNRNFYLKISVHNAQYKRNNKGTIVQLIRIYFNFLHRDSS